MTSANKIPYLGVSPIFKGEPIAAHAGHAVIGRVTVGADAWLGAGSVIRGDGHYISIGDKFHIGRGSTIHISHDRFPTIIGNRVTVGTNAVVHACTIGDDVVIGDGAVILDNATIGAGAVIEPNCIVFPSYKLAGEILYSERPAVAVQNITLRESLQYSAALREKNIYSDTSWQTDGPERIYEDSIFVADTAILRGAISIGKTSSIWYGCRCSAEQSEIRLGEQCNIQDNSVLTATKLGISIGDHTTIGHNVEINDCEIGSRCLIGMGSCISNGTVVQDDVFVAAGCTTRPGETLLGGYLWGGAPARILGTLDPGKRQIILETAKIYSEYAANLNCGKLRISD